MKQTIKLFAALVIMMGFTVSTTAQIATNQIKGIANVNTNISVERVVDLNFGFVSPGLTKTINLKNVATGGAAGEGTETTGVFSVFAQNNSNVNIKFTTLPTTLISGGNSLPISNYVAAYGATNPHMAGGDFVPADGINLSDFPTSLIGTQNGTYVFIGATVNPVSAQPSGNYEANITLTATYN